MTSPDEAATLGESLDRLCGAVEERAKRDEEAADGNPDDEPVLSASALQAIGPEVWDAAGVTTRPATIATDGADVPLRRIRPADAEAARVLSTLYDHAAVDYSWWRQTVAKGRTIVEAAWFDGRQTADDAGSPRESSAWQQWQRRHRPAF